MIIIKIDPVGTTSLLSATSTTDSIADDIEDVATTALTACSTLTTSMPIGYAHADATQRYIDSLSDTQLVEMEQRLMQKEDKMSINMNGEEFRIEAPVHVKKYSKSK